MFKIETRYSHFSTDEEKIRKRHPGFGLSLETKLIKSCEKTDSYFNPKEK